MPGINHIHTPRECRNRLQDVIVRISRHHLLPPISHSQSLGQLWIVARPILARHIAAAAHLETCVTRIRRSPLPSQIDQHYSKLCRAIP